MSSAISNGKQTGLLRKRQSAGFTYIGLLLFIAIGGIGLAIVGQVWHTEAQREREKELLFIGVQYAQAIGSYYESTPGGLKQYPASLQDLLQDNRFPVVRRHLRKLYRDPVTGSDEWGLIKQQERITGVYSLSQRRPVKQEGFAEPFAGFANAGQYQSWHFNYIASAGAAGTAGASTKTIEQPQGVVAPVAVTSAPALASADSAPVMSAGDPSVFPSTADGGNEAMANCQTTFTRENAQCLASCGNFSRVECRSCFVKSFNRYQNCRFGS